MGFRTLAFCTFIALVCLLTPATSFGQITGDIQIRAVDQSGAVIPGATVTLRSKATGATRTGVTDTSGGLRFPLLNIGEYELKIEAAGFAAFSSPATVNSGNITSVSATLEVQSASQQVVVAESALQINTVNSQLQASTDSERVINLPLNGGVLALAGTAPGITPVTPRNPFLGMGSFNSNGGRGRGNNITLDNANATDVSTTGSAGLGTAPIDSIKEFNIITNSFSAEYGRNSSAQVQLITKSGSNEFHGSLFEFFRNDKLNARDYFDRTGSPSILRDNNWGATGGGRIIKDKLFFFGSYTQQKIRGTGGTRLASIPTPSQVSAAPDATARELITRLKVPTDPSGTLTNPAPNVTDAWAVSPKIDWIISNRDSLFVRYGIQDSKTKSAGLTFINSNLPTNGANNVNRPQNGTVSETHSFSPNTVNTFLFSFGRSRPGFAPLETFGGPEIDFNDGTSVFGSWSGIPQGRVQNTFEYLDTVSHAHGRHLLKFGGDVSHIQANSYFDSNVRGTFTFLTLNDFLQGRPFAYAQRFGNSVRGNRITNGYFFAQDDFRVKPHLTLNLGMRLEVNSGVTEVNNLLSNLDLNKRDALGSAGAGPLGAFYTGGTYFNSTKNWAPRVGFAWNPRGGKTSIRGGYGIAYDFIFLNPITNGRFLPPFMYQFSLPQTDFVGDNTFARIVAGTSAFQTNGGATVGNFGTTIRNFGTISPIDRGLKNPQTQQFSLTIERELPFQMVGRVSYSGTKTNYLQRGRPLNLIAPGQFTAPNTAAEEEAQRASGLYTRLNSGLGPSFTTPSLRIDPRFNGVTLIESSANSNYHSLQFFVSRRFVNGYHFSLAYTFSKSIDDVSDTLGVLANDTPAQQDPNNNLNNRAVSQFDVPHRVVITHNFEPRWFASASNPFVRHVLGGWQFSGIFQAQSGLPANIVSGSRAGLADPTLLGGGGQVRPNLIGVLNVPFTPNPGSGGANPNLVTNSGLAQPLVGHFGALGRNVIRLNPLIQSDMTFGKEFKMTERFRTRFQAQIFNLFNNTTFSRPGLTLSAPATFGYYADTDTDTRNITLTLRLIW